MSRSHVCSTRSSTPMDDAHTPTSASEHGWISSYKATPSHPIPVLSVPARTRGAAASTLGSHPPTLSAPRAAPARLRLREGRTGKLCPPSHHTSYPRPRETPERRRKHQSLPALTRAPLSPTQPNHTSPTCSTADTRPTKATPTLRSTFFAGPEPSDRPISVDHRQPLYRIHQDPENTPPHRRGA
jgi:hypothetical protein